MNLEVFFVVLWICFELYTAAWKLHQTWRSAGKVWAALPFSAFVSPINTTIARDWSPGDLFAKQFRAFHACGIQGTAVFVFNLRLQAGGKSLHKDVFHGEFPRPLEIQLHFCEYSTLH